MMSTWEGVATTTQSDFQGWVESIAPVEFLIIGVALAAAFTFIAVNAGVRKYAGASTETRRTYRFAAFSVAGIVAVTVGTAVMTSVYAAASEPRPVTAVADTGRVTDIQPVEGVEGSDIRSALLKSVTVERGNTTTVIYTQSPVLRGSVISYACLQGELSPCVAKVVDGPQEEELLHELAAEKAEENVEITWELQ